MSPGAFLPKINMADFDYDLPAEMIANYPIPVRDASKLLVYNQGRITDAVFHQLSAYLPPQTTLIFNDTKVIPARLLFETEKGNIEVFLLESLQPDWSQWHCLIGNRRKFHEGEHLTLPFVSDNGAADILDVNWAQRDSNIIKLTVLGGGSIAEAIEKAGKVPLPPYIKREVVESDKERYQTVFAREAGAVAAPTASLHFTDSVLNSLKASGIQQSFLTLHVGAGTFKPVTVQFANEHTMHNERFSISTALVDSLINAPGPVIPVGTTSLRVVESLYYIGVNLSLGVSDFNIIKDDVGYNPALNRLSVKESLLILKEFMVKNGNFLSGETGIFIMPGYNFKLSKGIITNFHQPGSTLILLISALIGGKWEGVYTHAKAQKYRFLSYGDSSLLMP